MSAFDVQQIRQDFPILDQKVHGKPLVYLDNAASTQKPQIVIDTIADFYRNDYANIHRGVHDLSQRATRIYEEVRETVRSFINAPSTREIVFVRGATEGVNLVAQTFGWETCSAGDEILISEMEHHSNIVPWQLLAERRGVELKIIPMLDNGELDLDACRGMINTKTRLVAVVHMSNSLGTVNPIKEIVEIAHAQNVPVLVDGAQSIPHMPVDIQDLGCDFFTFSGHKAFGPTGIGVLWGRMELLDRMPPYQGGGDMILEVRFSGTQFNEVPFKFEAGTPNIAGTAGLGAALNYLTGIDMQRVSDYEQELLNYGNEVLMSIPGLEMIGQAGSKGSILSFTLENVHPHDIGTILDQEGIAVRSGHHCTQPVMDHYGIPATTRASLAFYNTKAEIDLLKEALLTVKEMIA